MYPVAARFCMTFAPACSASATRRGSRLVMPSHRCSSIVVAEPGYVIAKGDHDRVLDRGNHGWDPIDPVMHGIFVAAGPQIARAGRIPAFESVGVYPFLVAMLRLQRAPRTDGDPAALARYLR